MKHMPFPSNQNNVTHRDPSPLSPRTPWKKTQPGQPPPMMLQLQLHDGQIICFAYSDLREVRMRDAGYLALYIFGMEKIHIAIEGRHLTELGSLISKGKLEAMQELGPRTFEIPEECPSIDRITIEELGSA